jgi:hypothetical protein
VTVRNQQRSAAKKNNEGHGGGSPGLTTTVWIGVTSSLFTLNEVDPVDGNGCDQILRNVTMWCVKLSTCARYPWEEVMMMMIFFLAPPTT